MFLYLGFKQKNADINTESSITQLERGRNKENKQLDTRHKTGINGTMNLATRSVATIILRSQFLHFNPPSLSIRRKI